MLKVPVKGCRLGELLAADVYNDKGVVLISKNTVINGFLKEKLLDIGIRDIYIYADASDDNAALSEFKTNYTDALLRIKSFVNDIAAGKQLDYGKVIHATKQIQIKINENSSILKCLQEIRNVDEYTYTHCLNTAFYSMLIAKWMNFTERGISKVIQAGLLHDIGKTQIPVEILNKRGILTRDEFECVKKHTVLGYQILESLGDVDPDIKWAVLHHHERIDRSGYPFRAAPDDVGIFAKIIAVADVFDAMTSDRSYKKRVTPFDAFEMYQTVGVSIFETKVLRTFIKHIVPYYTGSKVLLSNDNTAEIVYIPPHDITHPVVLSGSDYIDLSNYNGVKIVEIINSTTELKKLSAC